MPTDSTKPPRSLRPRSLFRPANTTVFRALIFGIGGLLASSAYAVFEYYHSPYWNGLNRPVMQPVLFSHRHHAGELRIDCRYCHATVETSAFAGMPTTQTCLNCHSQVFTDTAMLQPVIRSATAGDPIRWTLWLNRRDVYRRSAPDRSKWSGCIGTSSIVSGFFFIRCSI